MYTWYNTCIYSYIIHIYIYISFIVDHHYSNRDWESESVLETDQKLLDIRKHNQTRVVYGHTTNQRSEPNEEIMTQHDTTIYLFTYTGTCIYNHMFIELYIYIIISYQHIYHSYIMRSWLPGYCQTENVKGCSASMPWENRLFPTTGRPVLLKIMYDQYTVPCWFFEENHGVGSTNIKSPCACI